MSIGSKVEKVEYRVEVLDEHGMWWCRSDPSTYEKAESQMKYLMHLERDWVEFKKIRIMKRVETISDTVVEMHDIKKVKPEEKKFISIENPYSKPTKEVYDSMIQISRLTNKSYLDVKEILETNFELYSKSVNDLFKNSKK